VRITEYSLNVNSGMSHIQLVTADQTSLWVKSEFEAPELGAWREIVLMRFPVGS